MVNFPWGKECSQIRPSDCYTIVMLQNCYTKSFNHTVRGVSCTVCKFYLRKPVILKYPASDSPQIRKDIKRPLTEKQT